MDTFLPALLGFIVPFFAVTSMAGTGLGHTVREVTRPLRTPGPLLLALIANFALSPLVAWGISRLLRLEEPHAVGLLLISTGAGAAFLVPLIGLARSNLTMGAGVLAVLLVGSLIVMPLAVPFLLPGARVGVADIAPPLLFTMLLPLGVGLGLHRWAPRLARRLRPILGKASQLALMVLIAGTFILHLPSIRAMIGSGALLAAALYTLVMVVTGYTLGGRNSSRRVVLALGSGQRNIAAASLIASQVFEQPGPLVMVVVSSLVAFAVLFPAAFLLRRSSARRALPRPRFESTFFEGRALRRAG